MITSLATTEQSESIGSLELFLLHLRYREGRLINAEGNNPLLLDDPQNVWIVYSGAVDLFAIPQPDGANLSSPRHLFRSQAGQIFFGIDPDTQGPLRLMIRGTTDTRLLRMPVDRLWDLAAQLEYNDILAMMCASWVVALARSFSGELPPKQSLPLDAGQSYSFTEPQTILANRGVIWAKPGAAPARYLADPALAWNCPEQPLPLSKQLWLELETGASLEPIDTQALLQLPQAAESIAEFHRLACAALAAQQQFSSTIERQHWEERSAIEAATMQQALSHLAAPLARSAQAQAIAPASSPSEMLLAAARQVGQAIGVELSEPPSVNGQTTPLTLLKRIGRASHMQLREVRLHNQWWRKDNGPLLAFQAADQQPVALLTNGSHYRLWNPRDGSQHKVTQAIAKRLSPQGYMFYRPLPDAPQRLWQLVRFGLHGTRNDLLVLLLAASLIGLLGLVPPIASGLIINTLIPGAQTGLLIQLGLGLGLVAMFSALLQIARGRTLLRIQSRFDAQLQAAVWDKLLKLPVPFFRNDTAGALGVRAMGVSQISRLLSGPVVNTLLNTIFSLFNLGLLFYYSPPLALLALGIVSVALIITTSISFIYLRSARKQTALESQVSSVVLQLLKGVVKLRVAGAENQAFAQWAAPFSAQRGMAYQSRKATNLLVAYNAGYPLFALLAIFTLAALSPQALRSVGDLVAFNLAFAQFLASWSLLGATLINILPVIPIYEQLQPILQAQPEIDQLKANPGQLDGKLEIAKVGFRYSEKGPLVLQDISLEIQPGEFVALVGTSGSGKSTMLRLLLGFDQPTAGAIYYSDQDLADLDLREVRTQIGVVLQNATLLSGEIASNIIGSALNLTLDDAWEAARLAGIDEDIRAMPMGMHTIVSEGGANLSGGQRQRLLIARALVNKPRILFFDEATSALDNRTQDVVSRSIEALQATRIVIAHRLSTIIRADRIIVFDQGKIAQIGTYDQLINQPGPFAELARRQKL